MKKYPLLKNNRLILCLLILCSPSIMSQTIVKCYENMPDILNPTLTKQNRLELVEYFKAKQVDSVANRFDHQVHLLKLDTVNQRILVKNTRTSTFDMKLIKQADSTIVIGIIRTVCAPVCLSSIEFYDTSWNLIPVRFNMPKSIEWLDVNNIPTDKIDLQWAKNLMGVSFISLSFSEKDQTIIARNNTLDFLSNEDRKVISPYVSDKTITFELKGQQWQRK